MSGQPSYDNIPKGQPPKSSSKKIVLILLAVVGLPLLLLCGGGVMTVFFVVDAAQKSTMQIFESAEFQQQFDQLIESQVSTGLNNGFDANLEPPRFDGTLSDNSTFKIAPDQWQLFQSNPGRFQVMLPGPANSSSEKIDSDIGQLTLFTLSVSLENDSAAVVVMYYDYPAELFRSKKASAILDDAANSVSEGRVSHSYKNNNLLIDGIPGREIHFEVNNENQITHSDWRLFLYNKRLYQVGIVGMNKPMDPDVVDYIFESFEIKQ